MYNIINNCVKHYNDKDVNFIFLDKFLKQINTNNYCNIGDIIDLEITCKYLKNFNIFLIDYHNFEFKIVEASYGINMTSIIVTDKINSFLKNNIFHISTEIDLNSLKCNPVDYFHNNYYIPLHKDNVKLYITYSINNFIFKEEYDQINGHLVSDILIDLLNVDFKIPPNILYMDLSNKLCTSLMKNIAFKSNFSKNASYFIRNNIKSTKKVNCIHLRLEEDAIIHWAKINNISHDEFKYIIEEKYINEIKENLMKDDNTIILSGNYENRVIQFLKENGYNFLLTPKMDKNRDVSAIYDLHIGEYCNNVYIYVFDSTFSVFLGYRLHYIPNNNIKFIKINVDFNIEKIYNLKNISNQMKSNEIK
jgi:hypothetical protein